MPLEVKNYGGSFSEKTPVSFPPVHHRPNKREDTPYPSVHRATMIAPCDPVENVTFTAICAAHLSQRVTRCEQGFSCNARRPVANHIVRKVDIVRASAKRGRMSRRQRSISNRPSSRLWLKVLGALAALLVLGIAGAFLGFKSWAMSYLRSEKFRKMVESNAGQDIRGRVEISPIRFEGGQFYSEGMTALGGPEAGFHSVKIDNVRGDFRLPSLWQVLFGDRKGFVDNVEVQRFDADFDDPRTEISIPPKSKHRHSEVLNIAVRDTRLKWRGGGLVNLAVKMTPRENGWMFEGSGGRIDQLGIPSIEVTKIRAMYNEPAFFLQELVARHDGGEIVASGELRPQDKADLQFVVKGVNVTPFLPDDWRARLHGRLAGDVRYAFSTRDGDTTPGQISGTVRLEGGQIEALPVLAKIADFTKTDQFRRMRLDELSAEFQAQTNKITVSKFVMESKQLLAVRGAFTIINDQVDGTFDVGITTAPLQWLPGSQEHVFTVNRDGYAWTKMRITGPTSAVKEDLSPRLVAAAESAAIQKVGDTAKGVLENGVKKNVDTAVDAARKGVSGAVDLLFGK